MQGTGGGPSINISFTNFEEEVLEFLTPEAAGLEDIPEGGINLTSNVDNQEVEEINEQTVDEDIGVVTYIIQYNYKNVLHIFVHINATARMYLKEYHMNGRHGMRQTYEESRMIQESRTSRFSACYHANVKSI